jgi:hypothetical protein
VAIPHIKRLDVDALPAESVFGGLAYRKYLYNDEEAGVHFSMNLADRPPPDSKARSYVNYHVSAEEVFYLAGRMLLYDDYYVRYCYRKGCYLYRPGGWVHGPIERLEHCELLEWSEGPLEMTHGEFDDLGMNPLENNVAKALGNRGLIKCLDSDALPWTPGSEFLKEHKWYLGDIDESKIGFKMLSKDRVSGAASVVVKLEPGFRIPTPGYANVIEEAFVVDGEMTISGERFGRHFFYRRPAGIVSGTLETSGGCELFMRVWGPLERRESEASTIDKMV